MAPDPTAHTGPAADVIVVDLSSDIDQVLARPFSDYQRDAARRPRGGIVDASRVLVHGTPQLLARAAPALDRIVQADTVRQMLCVIRGSFGTQVQHEIELPPALELARAATIWVEDPRGVIWDMKTTQAEGLAVYDQDPDGNNAFLMFLTCLQLPEVFDDVFRRAKTMDALVSPAFRLFVPGVINPDLVQAAEQAVVRDIAADSYTETGNDIATKLFANKTYASLFGKLEPPGGLFISDGFVSQSLNTTSEQVGAAINNTLVITNHPPAGREPVLAATADIRLVGVQLQLLKAQLRTVCATIDGTNGMNDEEIQLLQTLGVQSDLRIYKEEELDRDHERALRDITLTAIQRPASLRQITDNLREVQRRAQPQAPAAVLPNLERVCPDRAVENLRSYPALRVRWTEWQTLAMFLVLAVASGCLPRRWPVVPLALLLVLLLLVGWDTSQRRPEADPAGPGRERYPAGPPASRRPTSLAVDVTVVVTVLVGLALGEVLIRWQPYLGLHIAAPIVAAGMLVLLALHPWQAAAKRWLAGADLKGAAAASQNLVGTVASTVVNDWSWAGPRARYAATAGKLAVCIDEMRSWLHTSQLIGGSAKPDRSAPPDPQHLSGFDVLALPCNPAIRVDLAASGENNPYLQVAARMVQRNYADMFVNAISQQWSGIVHADKQTAVSQVIDSLSEQISKYRAGLARTGFLELQENMADDTGDGLDQQYQELLSDIWDGMDLSNKLKGSTGTPLIQLCSSGSLSLLDQDPANTQLSRFVPSSSRNIPGMSDLVRTRSPLMAGLIRLVPTRAVVRYDKRPDIQVQQPPSGTPETPS